MNSNLFTPKKAYKILRGGQNFLIVFEIYIYKDNYSNHIILKQDKLLQKIYDNKEFLQFIDEEEYIFLGIELINSLIEVVKKSKITDEYIIFFSAISKDGIIITRESILNKKINLTIKESPLIPTIKSIFDDSPPF